MSGQVFQVNLPLEFRTCTVKSLLYEREGWGVSFEVMKLAPRTPTPLLKALSALLVAGCSATGPVRPPEQFEEDTFKSISSFYCEYKRWPNDWIEFKDYLVSVGQGDTIGEDYPNATLESPRAVLATLNYEHIIGSPKKVSFIAPPQCEGVGDPRDVLMCGSRVGFRLPSGFSVMGGVAIKERWRVPPFPDAAWRSKSGGYVIAFRFGEVLVEPVGIPEFKQTLEAAYETSIPSLKWLVREVVEQNGRTFLAHEFESDSSRGRLVTVIISTSFDGKLLTINVVGPVEGRVQVEDYAREVTNSLRLN